MNLTIKDDDRVTIVGQTGSGKTYLASKLLSSKKRLVVIDSTGLLSRKFNTKEFTKKGLKSLYYGDNIRLRIKPPILSTSDIPKFYDDVFSELLSIGNLTIYIDEAYGVTQGKSNVPAYTNAIYTRGRGLGISVWTSTQRPSWIPLFMLSEANVFFMFNLMLDQDKKRMSSLMGNAVMNKIPDKYGFYLKMLSNPSIYYIRKLTVE